MTQVTSLNSMEDNPAMLLLHRLAVADPDFLAEKKRLASLTHLTLSAAEQTALAQETLAVLRESPEQKQAIRTLTENHEPAKNYDGGLLTAGVLVAIVFLLRSHIKVKRHNDGRLEFLFEHKPADSKLLSQLLDRLAALLPKGP